MFHGELTAALILYAYDKPDLNAVDHAVRMVLNYQASLEQPLHHQAFVEIVAQVMAQQPPPELVAFLARDVTHRLVGSEVRRIPSKSRADCRTASAALFSLRRLRPFVLPIFGGEEGVWEENKISKLPIIGPNGSKTPTSSIAT